MKKYFILILSFLFLYSFKPDGCSGKGGVCSLNFKEVVKSEEGTLKGKILCKRCDLNLSDKCQKVLSTEDEKIYEFCSCSQRNKDLENLEGKKVEVKGKICQLKDGTLLIHSESFKILKDEN